MDASLRWATRFNSNWLAELKAHGEGVFIRVGLYFGDDPIVPGTVVWVCGERTARVGSLFRTTCDASYRLCVQAPWTFMSSVRLLANQYSTALAGGAAFARIVKIDWQGESWARSSPLQPDAVVRSVPLEKPRSRRPTATRSAASGAAEEPASAEADEAAELLEEEAAPSLEWTLERGLEDIIVEEMEDMAESTIREHERRQMGAAVDRAGVDLQSIDLPDGVCNVEDEQDAVLQAMFDMQPMFADGDTAVLNAESTFSSWSTDSDAGFAVLRERHAVIESIGLQRTSQIALVHAVDDRVLFVHWQDEHTGRWIEV